MPPVTLPNPNLKWAHSTCTKEALDQALSDPNITAIETDLVMGYVIPSSSSPSSSLPKQNKDDDDEEDDDDGEEGYNTLIPIMSHPPSKESNVSMKYFLKKVSYYSNHEHDSKERKLKKHIKLDFKEIATVRPTLEQIQNLQINFSGNDDSIVFLNADILLGPAMRNESHIIVDKDLFLATCANFINENKTPYALSLGWRTDCRAWKGYTMLDIQIMIDLLYAHELIDYSGIVFAVNARVLYKNLAPMKKLLLKLPSSQLLIWTATGEPAISEYKIIAMEEYFRKWNLKHRVGFDCKVTPIFAHGLWFDFLVSLSSVFFYSKKLWKRPGKIGN